MTSNHLDSDGPGLTALKYLFEKQAFVFAPANSDKYKIWVTVPYKGRISSPEDSTAFRDFIEAFSKSLGIEYTPKNISMVDDPQNKTISMQYAFPADEIERVADKLKNYNIAHQLKNGVGIRFLDIAKYEHERIEGLNQARLEEQMLDELHLATGVEWTIRESGGALSYMPVKPVPKAYGALLVLCDKNALNLPECIPERYIEGGGMIRIPVEAVKFENYRGLKGQDLSDTFKPAQKGKQA